VTAPLVENDTGVYWSSPSTLKLAQTKLEEFLDDMADPLELLISDAAEAILDELIDLIEARLGTALAAKVRALRPELAVRAPGRLEVRDRTALMQPNMIPAPPAPV
jgi:hypothetical protein